MDCRSGWALEGRDVVVGDSLHVDQSGLERGELLRTRRDVDERDARQMDGLGVPVFGVLDQDDLLTLDVALQDERPGTDDVEVRGARSSTRSAMAMKDSWSARSG